jgi:hypothetical protein
MKQFFSLLLITLLVTGTGCTKLQSEREFDATQHALSFEIEATESAARLTATIEAEHSDLSMQVELSMSNDDTDYVSEPIHLASGTYTISEVSVFGHDDTTIYSVDNLSVTLQADSTVSLD